MLDEEEIIIISVIGFVILLIIFCAFVYQYRKKQQSKPRYEIADNFSVLGSEVHFEKEKQWLGQEGLNNYEKEQMNQRLQKQYEMYAAAMRVATNYCRDAGHQRKIRDDLPCIGYRTELKFFYPLSDDKLDKEIHGDAVLLTHYDLVKCPVINYNALIKEECLQPLGACRVVDFEKSDQFRAFHLMFETLEHPYIARTYNIGLSHDEKHLFLFRDFEQNGSLRDHIHQANLSRPYSEKYNRPSNTPLSQALIRKFGRQILEAMAYLSQCGIVHYHLHSGNIIIHDQTVKLSEIENNILGLIPRHPFHKHLISLKKLYGNLNVELCLFGYVLFEMATGMECPEPSPLDCLRQTQRPIPQPIKDILGRIFGDKTFGLANSATDLISDPFFSATNVPPINTASFTKLREENETVDKIIKSFTSQCFYTYSREFLLGEDYQNVADSSKSKKKKKKKSRGMNNPNDSTPNDQEAPFFGDDNDEENN